MPKPDPDCCNYCFHSVIILMGLWAMRQSWHHVVDRAEYYLDEVGRRHLPTRSCPGKIVPHAQESTRFCYNTAMGETALSPGSIGQRQPGGHTMGLWPRSRPTALFRRWNRCANADLLGALILNQPMVMWITNDDIFVSVRFTVWG